MSMEVRQNIHRRKSSKDEDENLIVVTPPPLSPASTDVDTHTHTNGITPALAVAPSSRSRVHSTPAHPVPQHQHQHSLSPSVPPPSAGPFRTSFTVPRAPNGINGHPSSPFRSSFSIPTPSHSHSHSRARSISTPFTPVLPSPLSSSFPSHSHLPTSASPTTHTFPTSISAPDTLASSSPPLAPQKHIRRHSRLHSRNLSVFFPRAGSLPHTTISEDGTQELELHVDEEAPISTIPSAGRSISLPHSRGGPPTPLGAGFTFGARPPPDQSPLPQPSPMSATSSSSSRRGHHHKHSMSHNFFSFLEPGSAQRHPASLGEELHTQPALTPVSPWTPISPFPPGSPARTPPLNGGSVQLSQPPNQIHAYNHIDGLGTIPMGAAASTMGQFLLGGWLWIQGQQVGSLACTGLGYWVVFDAFGVGLGSVLPQWWGFGIRVGEKEKIRRPYGNARLETVLMFAQAVYLMFSSVYVCKETVEHLLLSAGSGEGHHHHHGDEDEGAGIEFPVFLTFITLLSLAATALVYNNHSKLVNLTGNRIPSIGTLARSLSSPSRLTRHHDPPPTSALGLMLTNPFVASPLFFCVAILFVSLSVPPAQHRMFDLVLAAVITFVTFNAAYRASVVLGTVLLQTSPQRGMAGGRMEAFLRAMREVERHPQVLHLPAPHIWQLTPSPSQVSASASRAPGESLVVTLELHVKDDMGDDDVLALTKWTWEKCVGALGHGREKGGDGALGAEVTVGVVRG